LLGATIGLACGVGMYTPITSIFFRAFEVEFGWSKTAIAVGLLALPLTGIALPFAGRLIDRFGVRNVAMLSAVAMAVSFLYLSLIGQSLAAFYIGFIGFNVLGCATGPVAYTRPVAARFSASKGVAIAIALSGISISGILLSPLLGNLLAHGGWRTGYRLLAAVALIGGLAAMWLIRPTSEGVRAGGQDGLTRRDAIRTIAFWQLGGAIFLAGAGSVGFVSQLQSVAIEFGTPAERSGILLAILALSVMIFRVVAGWSLDRLAPRLIAAAFFIASGLGLAVWLLPHGSMALAVVGTLALGLSVGSEHAFISFFCARLFGMRAYSAIFGALAVFLYFGMAAGGLVFARSRDLSGSYSIAIVAATVGLVVAGLLLATLPARVKAGAQ
jgi:predicted MFS family arabinose efflux permease